jgi:hypothetical protein
MFGSDSGVRARGVCACGHPGKENDPMVVANIVAHVENDEERPLKSVFIGRTSLTRRFNPSQAPTQAPAVA